MPRKMTKKKAEQQFKEEILPIVKAQEKNGKDAMLRNQEWSYFIDSLCRDGLITQDQFHNWDSPKVCQY